MGSDPIAANRFLRAPDAHIANFDEVLNQLGAILAVVASWIAQIKVSPFTQPILNALDYFVLDLTLNMSQAGAFNTGHTPPQMARVMVGNRLLYEHRQRCIDMKREHGDFIE